MKAIKILFCFMTLVPVVHAEPKFGELLMTGPDSGNILYADRCANGGNIDKAKEDEFVKAMLANPDSKLSRLKAQLIKEIGNDARGEGVYFGDREQSFHFRDGCSASLNTFSFMVFTVTGGNSNYTVARFLVSVDDDDNQGVRTLKVRSIQAIKIRDDN